MRIIGKSLVHKVISIALLFSALGFVIYKSNLNETLAVITNAPITTNTYLLSADELQVSNEEQLYKALQSFQRNNALLSETLQTSGISLADFDRLVDMTLIINSDPLELNIEFVSSYEPRRLDSAYAQIVADLKLKLSEVK